MAKKSFQLRTIELGGVGITLHVGRTVSIANSPNQFIHLEEMRDGSWRVLYTSVTLPDPMLVDKIELVRDNDERRFHVHGQGNDLQLEIVTQLHLSDTLNTIQLDEYESGKWRLCYTAGVIPDITKFTHFQLQPPEDM